MADNADGGAPKQKLSTKDILAAARAAAAAKAGGGAAAPAPEPAAPAEPVPAEPALAATGEVPGAQPAAAEPVAVPKPPAGKPSSTADIIAAARAAAAAKNAGAGAPAAGAETKSAAAPKAPAASPGTKPKSTADILAAARAAAASKAAGADVTAGAAPAEKPAKSPAAAKAAAAKAAAPADAGGTKPSVQEMLAAVRPASVAVAAAPTAEPKPTKAAAVPVVVKPMPPKPAPAKPGAKQGVGETRRWFLIGGIISAFVVAWTALSVSAAIFTLGMARFMLPNVLAEPPRKFKIGSPSDYDLGTVATKWVASFGVWIVHTNQYKGRNLIYAILSVCTHLGCTPSWLEGEQKFKCPCHGSGFYITGVNFEGPAPRPLERVGIRIAEDGMLEVDKSVKFQEEMGQWADPNSYVEMA